MYQEWGVFVTNMTILFTSNCRRSLELCSRKVTEYSELTELLWKHEKLMLRVVYDGGLVYEVSEENLRVPSKLLSEAFLWYFVLGICGFWLVGG